MLGSTGLEGDETGSKGTQVRVTDGHQARREFRLSVLKNTPNQRPILETEKGDHGVD